MKIGIDVREVQGERVGKGEYVYNLVKSLVQYDHDNEYILYSNNSVDFDFKLPDNFKMKYILWPSWLWHVGVLMNFKRKFKGNIFVAPTSYIIPSIYKNSVVVVHDLVSILGKTKHQRKARLIEKALLKRALSNAGRVIAVSEHTKKDIIDTYFTKESKVKVVYPAITNLKGRDKHKVLNSYRLREGYWLFVGTIEPRKNLIRLFEAYSLIKKKKGYKLPKLVIVGKKGWYYEEIIDKVKRLNIENQVLFLGYVPRKDLKGLYLGAKLFVYPSLYEGFGLPVVEAMKNEVPVVTSNVSALLEAGGRDVIYVNPRKAESIKSGILKLDSNEELRKKLAKSGREQANKFDLKRMAVGYISLINKMKLK